MSCSSESINTASSPPEPSCKARNTQKLTIHVNPDTPILDTPFQHHPAPSPQPAAPTTPSQPQPINTTHPQQPTMPFLFRRSSSPSKNKTRRAPTIGDQKPTISHPFSATVLNHHPNSPFNARPETALPPVPEDITAAFINAQLEREERLASSSSTPPCPPSIPSDFKAPGDCYITYKDVLHEYGIPPPHGDYNGTESNGVEDADLKPDTYVPAPRPEYKPLRTEPKTIDDFNDLLKAMSHTLMLIRQHAHTFRRRIENLQTAHGVELTILTPELKEEVWKLRYALLDVGEEELYVARTGALMKLEGLMRGAEWRGALDRAVEVTKEREKVQGKVSVCGGVLGILLGEIRPPLKKLEMEELDEEGEPEDGGFF